MKQGRRVADKMFVGLKGSLKPKRLLAVAILDHKRMDVFVVDETRRYVLGRPWLAFVMDAMSRMPLGYALSFEDPSLLSLMASLRMAMRPQIDLKSKFPSVKGDWESSGIPKTILVDNAWENVGSTFADACSDFGISVEWAPSGHPERKGAVERFFRTLDVQITHMMPGAVTGPAHVLRERHIDPQATATLTLRELEELLVRYFVDDYPNREHTALRACPRQIWRRQARLDWVDLPHNPAEVDHAFGTVATNRRLTREGVRFEGLQYHSDAVDGLLSDLWRHQRATIRPGTAEIKIKYHPEDLSRICVWNGERQTYAELPCTMRSYSQYLSLRVHRLVRKQQRSEAAEFISEADALQSRALLIQSLREFHERQPVKERSRRAKLLGSEQSPGDLAPTISIDPLANRRNGDHPEKSSLHSKDS